MSAKTGSILVWLGVEAAARVGRQDATHEGVKTAVPARPRAGAFLGVGRDEHRDAIAE
jgi:hypothetical protein